MGIISTWWEMDGVIAVGGVIGGGPTSSGLKIYKRCFVCVVSKDVLELYFCTISTSKISNPRDFESPRNLKIMG